MRGKAQIASGRICGGRDSDKVCAPAQYFTTRNLLPCAISQALYIAGSRHYSAGPTTGPLLHKITKKEVRQNL